MKMMLTASSDVIKKISALLIIVWGHLVISLFCIRDVVPCTKVPSKTHMYRQCFQLQYLCLRKEAVQGKSLKLSFLQTRKYTSANSERCLSRNYKDWRSHPVSNFVMTVIFSILDMLHLTLSLPQGIIIGFCKQHRSRWDGSLSRLI